MTQVTETMRIAGSNIASALIDAQVSKCMDGLGGSKTWDEWCQIDIPNRDLIVDCLEERIDSVTAIYIAMDRCKYA